jgi:hypothetical protein
LKDILVERGHIQEVESIADEAQEQDTDQRAPDRPFASQDACPADDGCSDGVQLNSYANVRYAVSVRMSPTLTPDRRAASALPPMA